MLAEWFWKPIGEFLGEIALIVGFALVFVLLHYLLAAEEKLQVWWRRWRGNDDD